MGIDLAMELPLNCTTLGWNYLWKQNTAKVATNVQIPIFIENLLLRLNSQPTMPPNQKQTIKISSKTIMFVTSFPTLSIA